MVYPPKENHSLLFAICCFHFEHFGSYTVISFVKYKEEKVPYILFRNCAMVNIRTSIPKYYIQITIQVNLDMTDHYRTDFCIWWIICFVPVQCISSIRHMYTMDFAYDGPIFLVPLSLSYPSSPVFVTNFLVDIYCLWMGKMLKYLAFS